MNHNPEQFNELKQEYSSFVDIDPIRNYLHYPAVLTELESLKGQRILDVGCGDGLFAEKMANYGAHVTGYDLAPDLVQIAQKRSASNPNLEFVIAQPQTFHPKKKFNQATSVMRSFVEGALEYILPLLPKKLGRALTS